jgi:hypothetical protein
MSAAVSAIGGAIALNPAASLPDGATRPRTVPCFRFGGNCGDYFWAADNVSTESNLNDRANAPRTNAQMQAGE